MRTKAKLKHIEKTLKINRRTKLFIFAIMVPGYVDKGVGFKGGESNDEREQILRAKYPFRYRFLDNENNVEVLTEYFKTKGIVFPEPGNEINVLYCRFETITIMDEVIPYQELEPFMTPERVKTAQTLR